MLVHVLNALRNQKGQGMVEYGLIIALVGVALMAALGVLEGNISALFEGISFTKAAQ